MSQNDYKEVYFHEYCEKCEYKDTDEVKDPCNECYKYLNILLEKENDFNFNSYFSNTQFGIETYKINNNVLKGIKQIIF